MRQPCCLLSSSALADNGLKTIHSWSTYVSNHINKGNYNKPSEIHEWKVDKNGWLNEWHEGMNEQITKTRNDSKKQWNESINQSINKWTTACFPQSCLWSSSEKHGSWVTLYINIITLLMEQTSYVRQETLWVDVTS